MVSRFFRIRILLFLLFGLSPFHQLATAAGDVNLASVSAVVVDLEQKETLISKYDDVEMPVASITKLMTAMVVLDSGADLDERLEVKDWQNENDKNAYSRIRLGSTAKRRDLLRIALMSSENLAAYNLALHHPDGYEAFIAAMSVKAISLGMNTSYFTDPTGLSVLNTSTAGDLARMLIAANDYELIREYSTTPQFTVEFRKPRYRLGYGNTNPLIHSSRWDVSLSKTGYLTESGRCLLMVADVADHKLGVVLLNSLGKRSPLGDAGRIRRWLENGTEGSVSKAAAAYRQHYLQTLNLDP